MRVSSKVCLLAVGVALTFGSGYAAAQKRAPRANACANRFAILDVDKDGKVNRDEYLANERARAEQRFRAMDATGDGIVTSDELCNYMQAIRQKRMESCK